MRVCRADMYVLACAGVRGRRRGCRRHVSERRALDAATSRKNSNLAVYLLPIQLGGSLEVSETVVGGPWGDPCWGPVPGTGAKAVTGRGSLVPHLRRRSDRGWGVE